MARRNPTSVYLPAPQLKRLRALSKITGAPAAEIIRRALERYLGTAELAWEALVREPSLLASLSPLERVAVLDMVGMPLEGTP